MLNDVSQIGNRSNMVLQSCRSNFEIPKLYSTIEEVNKDLAGTSGSLPKSTSCSYGKDTSCYKAPHLFLHFDVNETILIGDPAGGDSVSDCLNKIIAKSAFVSTRENVHQSNNTKDSKSAPDASLQRSPSSGNISESSTHHLEPSHWWNGLPIDRFGPTPNYIETESDHDTIVTEIQFLHTQIPPPLYTGWHWPSNTCPYYRTKYKKTAKRFTESSHGKIYRPLYNLLSIKLGLDIEGIPTTASTATTNYSPLESSKKTKFATHETTNFPISKSASSPIVENQFQHFLPAFFYTLQYYFPSSPSSFSCDAFVEPSHVSLDETSFVPQLPPPPKVTLVLRTFGQDLPRVARVITDFAKGNHPLFPNYTNSDLILVERELYCASWKRYSQNSDISTATDDRHGDDDAPSPEMMTNDSLESFIYQLMPYHWNREKSYQQTNDIQGEAMHLFHSGDDQVLEFLQTKTVVGIQDDYSFWRNNQHAPWAGKPVWGSGAIINSFITRKNTVSHHHHHHILLDDNIHNDPNDGAGGIRIPIISKAVKTNGENSNIKNSNDKDENKESYSFYTSLPGEEALKMHGKHLIRVPTIKPLLEDDWFVRQIENARWRMFLEQQDE